MNERVSGLLFALPSAVIGLLARRLERRRRRKKKGFRPSSRVRTLDGVDGAEEVGSRAKSESDVDSDGRCSLFVSSISSSMGVGDERKVKELSGMLLPLLSALTVCLRISVKF